MRLNVMYLVSSILLIASLVSSPWVVVGIDDDLLSIPLYAVPKVSNSVSIESISVAVMGVINFIATILLIVSLFFMLLSTYTEKAVSFARNSLMFTIVWSTILIVLFSILVVFQRYGIINLNVQCVAYPSYTYLLIAYALLVAAKDFSPQIIRSDGTVVPIELFKRRKVVVTTMQEVPRSEEEVPSEEGKEEHEEKAEEKREERREQEEKESKEENVYVKVARELLEGG